MRGEESPGKIPFRSCENLFGSILPDIARTAEITVASREIIVSGKIGEERIRRQLSRQGPVFLFRRQDLPFFQHLVLRDAEDRFLDPFAFVQNLGGDDIPVHDRLIQHRQRFFALQGNAGTLFR